MESSKVIIGINAYHADSSACLLINGKLICAIEEKRLNRKKHYSGFPFESIKECLEIANKVAGASTTKLGAGDSMPVLKDINLTV